MGELGGTPRYPFRVPHFFEQWVSFRSKLLDGHWSYVVRTFKRSSLADKYLMSKFSTTELFI